jgi:predicted RNA binding protein YcfA (HicA-like mRNA interferase family)
MTQKELLRYLEENGWVLRRAKTGTHMTFRKDGAQKILTIKDTPLKYRIPCGVIADIKRRSGLTFEVAK